MTSLRRSTVTDVPAAGRGVLTALLSLPATVPVVDRFAPGATTLEVLETLVVLAGPDVVTARALFADGLAWTNACLVGTRFAGAATTPADFDVAFGSVLWQVFGFRICKGVVAVLVVELCVVALGPLVLVEDPLTFVPVVI